MIFNIVASEALCLGGHYAYWKKCGAFSAAFSVLPLGRWDMYKKSGHILVDLFS